MILEETEVKERLESPLNLMNRLRNITNNHRPERSSIPSLPPSSDQVIEDLEQKLAFGSIKSKAANLVIEALDELKARMPEVQRPEKLAAIAESMNKIVTSESNKNNNEKPSQYVIFAPSFVDENHYETIYARE